MPDILVLASGFAGIWAALTAARENIVNAGGLSVALVTRDPFLTVRPRLYEAGPEHLRAPLLPVLEPVDVALVTGQAERIDPQARTVTLIGTDGRSSAIPWCRLIVATGSIAAMPPIHGLETHGFTIDDHKAAMKLDVHMRRLLETPESGSALTFAILGAGFTGIELACEMRDRIAVHAGEQRAQDARIVLL